MHQKNYKTGIKFFSWLSWWLSSKESTCQCKRHRFDPWVGKILWRRKWWPTSVFVPGKSHEQRSLVGYSPRGLNGHEFGQTPGHSGGGAWCAAVYGVAKSLRHDLATEKQQKFFYVTWVQNLEKWHCKSCKISWMKNKPLRWVVSYYYYGRKKIAWLLGKVSTYRQREISKYLRGQQKYSNTELGRIGSIEDTRSRWRIVYCERRPLISTGISKEQGQKQYFGSQKQGGDSKDNCKTHDVRG